MIRHGDCLTVMATMPDASVDAIVTDPPYGLSFMGKAWDHGVPAGPFWAEMLRVAKPGAYLLAFGGTRTVHRIATNIEDAGWIIRDMLVWCYASGFPKGRANLKPAWEPIVMARKPGPLRHLNIDECRIGTPESKRAAGTRSYQRAEPGGRGQAEYQDAPHDGLGRWPSNLLLSDPDLFDEHNAFVVGSGAVATSGGRHFEEGARKVSFAGTARAREGAGGATQAAAEYHRESDVGGYSRFFIIPKADRADREPDIAPDGHDRSKRFSTHPTMKPTDLMRHLIRLVTPPGGVVLDPFAGSGTTGKASLLEGFDFILIEKEREYIEQIEARLNGVQRGLGLDTPLVGQPRVSRDGVAVRHNSGGNTFGGDKPKPPLSDMGYGTKTPQERAAFKRRELAEAYELFGSLIPPSDEDAA